jgi:hypothetical protein
MSIRGANTAADQNVLTDFAPPTAEGATSSAATPSQQVTRAQTLRDIGLTEARESAVTGDTKAAGTDFQLNKVDGPGGDRMSGVIDSERAAVQGYAEQLRDNAAGTASNDYQRGAAIAEPVQQMHDWYDNQIKQTYDAADAQAQGTPINMPATAQVLSQKGDFGLTAGGEQLRKGVMTKMRETGLMDEDGNVQPGTVRQAQALRQSLTRASNGDNWQMVKQLTNAIDDDTAAAAGSDVYKQARALRSQRATMLDDPTGIGKLAPPTDRLGINRAVPLEKIGDYVTSLPADQFQHLVGTLRNAPAQMPGVSALHDASASALNEIRAHFAEKTLSAGNSTQSMWNAKAVSKYLADNEQRMRQVYSPDEMQNFKKLNDAGNILRMNRSYPGSYAQELNLKAHGLVAGAIRQSAGAVGAAIGGHYGEPLAAREVGLRIGDKATGRLDARAATKAIESRIRKL